jgi:uncharacterized protein YqgQ
LESIFNLNYLQHFLQTGETATIVMMGMQINIAVVCLATLKVNIANGRITQATAINHQEFWVHENNHSYGYIKFMEPREYSIDMAEIKMKANLNAIDKENTEEYNKKINKAFANKIKSLRE